MNKLESAFRHHHPASRLLTRTARWFIPEIHSSLECPAVRATLSVPMAKFHILVADPISQTGIDLLQAEPSFEVVVNLGLKKESDFCEAAKDANAIVVRSGVKVTAKVMEAAPNLKVIGRAGVGVDNIDVPAASKRGVVVMNTPGGNTISTAEHAFALMTSLARKIPQAHANVASGKFDRKTFQGTELNKKTLAVLGMGRIGAEFAKRAQAFGMRVVAMTPTSAPTAPRCSRWSWPTIWMTP